MQLTILGNNSALPNHDRYPTAQVLAVGNELILIDCGEGTQVRLQKNNIKTGKISKIFISHLHGDHYFGLIGLLTRFSLNSRTEPIDLYGPASLIDVINLQLKLSDSILSYPLYFHPIPHQETTVICTQDNLEVTAFPTMHRIACYGFRFEEINRERKLLIDEVAQYSIPISWYKRLKDGEDYIDAAGGVLKNELFTESGKGNRVYAFGADTKYTEQFLEHIMDAHVLYHETTYLHDQEALAIQRFHSTTVHAASIALKAAVGQLIIGHFSSKYTDLQPFLEETTAIFPNTALSYEGMVIEI